ncbi:hypothetical protein MKX03_031887 [Papaver bracteatum]|nr:hypothetical protein MKX03_031887 [Papaver bracteatum]
MCDTMQFVQPDVHTICIGLAASMGSFVLVGGEITKHEIIIESNETIIIFFNSSEKNDGKWIIYRSGFDRSSTLGKSRLYLRANSLCYIIRVMIHQPASFFNVACLLFETCSVVLVDGDRILRDDVPFRREESNYSIDDVGVTVEFYGGELNEVSYSNPATVKKYAIRAQLGEILN